MVKESKRGLTKWWMRSAKRHQVDGAPFLCIYLLFLANGFIRRCNLQPAACLDVASNKTHHRARPRGPVSRFACPCLAIILENYQHPHEQTLSQRRNPAACRGENSQGRWKRRHFHPRLTYTQSLGDVEPVPVPTALQVLQAGTRNWLFQCRLGATRRLCPCEKREQVETQKDTLTDQHQEHHGILNIRFMTSQAKSLPAPNPETNTDKKKPRKAHLPPSRCIPISALAPPAARMASSRPHWPDPDSATTPLSLTAFS